MKFYAVVTVEDPYALSDEVAYVPGEAVPGEQNEEFVVNEEKLKKILIKMFYKIC